MKILLTINSSFYFLKIFKYLLSDINYNMFLLSYTYFCTTNYFVFWNTFTCLFTIILCCPYMSHQLLPFYAYQLKPSFCLVCHLFGCETILAVWRCLWTGSRTTEHGTKTCLCCATPVSSNRCGTFIFF